MSLLAAYQQFLSAPNSSMLSPDATLHYITTTTSYKGATDIIKHLGTLRYQVKKKKEDFLSIIEGEDAAAIEVDTTFEFAINGGPYLPGLDDNFLTDRTCYLPIMHIVRFDNNGKILQIRQSWDQGSLLKQLDIIGKSGRNWPIRDSKDQIKLISNALKSTGSEHFAQDVKYIATHSRGNSTNMIRDPHASLSLFAPLDEADKGPASVISPRAGARPKQRSFTEILGDEPTEEVASPSSGRDRSERPGKAIAPKAGAGKNFQPSRLFETEEELDDVTEDNPSPERFYRPNPKKFNHFDFADGSEEQDAPQRGDPTPVKTKHSSQWSFDDFVTPQKVNPSKTLRKNHQALRHWGTEGDEVEETPQRKPVQNKLRRDAESHFELKDDGTPREPRATRPRGATHNNGLALYKNNVYREDGEEPACAGGDSQALGNITNTNLKDRGKTFEPQFDMTDDSPKINHQSKPSVGEDRKKFVKMMDANWSMTDTSPSQKENQPTKPKSTKSGGERGIRIGGDGMGGSKGTNRDWLFGDGDDDDLPPVKSVPGKKQGGAAAGGFNWDF